MIVKRTGTSKSAKSEIRYIEAHKAHKNNNGITKRNLAVTGFNCRTDSRQHTYADFKSQLNKANHKIKTQNFVISSKKGDFDPNNPEDIYRFEQFAIGFTKRAFAKPTQAMEQAKKKKQPIKPVSADKLNTPHYPILIALQADNTRGILHAHIIVGNANIYNHKALPSKYRDIYHLRRADDDEVRVYNNKFKDNKIYDLSKNYKITPTPRQKSIANLLHQCMNDPKIDNLTKVRKNFKQNGITFKVRRPRKISKYTNKSYRKSNKKHNYRNHRGVVFEITNGKIHKTNNEDKSTTTSKKDNKKTYIKLSSISWVYKKAYGTGINYGMIKHNLALKRMGEFKPIRNTKASSTKSKPTPTPTSSVSINPATKSIMDSQLVNAKKGFLYHHHNHESIPHFHSQGVKAVVNSLDNEEQQTNKSIANDGLQPQFSYSKSSASSESEEDNTVTKSSSSKPRVSPAPMPKFNVHIKKYATHDLKGHLSVPKEKAFLISPYNTHYIHYGNHYFKKYHHFFKYPIFTSPRLENLIQRDLRESDSEDKKISDLKDFENNCSKEDQAQIDTRIDNEATYIDTKKLLQANAADIKNLEHKAYILKIRRGLS